MTTTAPLTSHQLLDLAMTRQVAVLVRPDGSRVGALPLFPADLAHLAKGSAPATLGSQVWAATWSRGSDSGQLELVDPPAWRMEPPRPGAVLAPLDFLHDVLERPQPVLEALALAVRHQLRVTISRAKGTGRERRRLAGIKINPTAQVLVAHDRDRDAPRSFRLRDVLGVRLEAGQPLPVWEDGLGYTVDGRNRRTR